MDSWDGVAHVYFSDRTVEARAVVRWEALALQCGWVTGGKSVQAQLTKICEPGQVTLLVRCDDHPHTVTLCV